MPGKKFSTAEVEIGLEIAAMISLRPGLHSASDRRAAFKAAVEELSAGSKAKLADVDLGKIRSAVLRVFDRKKRSST